MIESSLKVLLETLPQIGRVEWIGIRPQRRARIEVLQTVQADTKSGLEGDRYLGRDGKRQVTLIQYEHLSVIGSNLSKGPIDPMLLRRNIAVSGINLLALKDKCFFVGDVVLEYTGLCHPCSLMEKALGVGGYNAVRGHGGITVRVVRSGGISIGDSVSIFRDH